SDPNPTMNPPPPEASEKWVWRCEIFPSDVRDKVRDSLTFMSRTQAMHVKSRKTPLTNETIESRLPFQKSTPAKTVAAKRIKRKSQPDANCQVLLFMVSRPSPRQHIPTHLFHSIPVLEIPYACIKGAGKTEFLSTLTYLHDYERAWERRSADAYLGTPKITIPGTFGTLAEWT
ncbi:MAG TPA: hypothetical protein VGN88_10560, partial [Phycisphaerae bacterium]